MTLKYSCDFCGCHRSEKKRKSKHTVSLIVQQNKQWIDVETVEFRVAGTIDLSVAICANASSAADAYRHDYLPNGIPSATHAFEKANMQTFKRLSEVSSKNTRSLLWIPMAIYTSTWTSTKTKSCTYCNKPSIDTGER